MKDATLKYISLFKKWLGNHFELYIKMDENGIAKESVLKDSEEAREFVNGFCNRSVDIKEFYYIIQVIKDKEVMAYIPIPRMELYELLRFWGWEDYFSNVYMVNFSPLFIQAKLFEVG